MKSFSATWTERRVGKAKTMTAKATCQTHISASSSSLFPTYFGNALRVLPVLGALSKVKTACSSNNLVSSWSEMLGYLNRASLVTIV